MEFPSHPNLLQQHLRNNHLSAAAAGVATDDSSLGSFNLESNTEHDADIDEEYRCAYILLMTQVSISFSVPKTNQIEKSLNKWMLIVEMRPRL